MCRQKPSEAIFSGFLRVRHGFIGHVDTNRPWSHQGATWGSLAASKICFRMLKFLILILGAIFEAPKAPQGLSLSLLGSSWTLSEHPWALPHAESTAIYSESVTALNSLRRAPGAASEPPGCSAEASGGAPSDFQAPFWVTLESPGPQNCALV